MIQIIKHTHVDAHTRAHSIRKALCVINFTNRFNKKSELIIIL